MMRRPHVVLQLAAGIAIAVAAPASAGPSAATDAAGTLESVSSGPVTIRTGRALDFEGKPVWAGNASFSQTARVATFLTSPPVQRRTTQNYSVASARPLVSGAITSGFGMRGHPILGRRRMHAGVDLAAPAGSPILATSSGVVRMAGWGGGYGLTVRLEHLGGLETRYAHMSGLAVAPGQRVQRGDVIGYVGSTGLSTGPHLHYEMRVDGVPVHPRL